MKLINNRYKIVELVESDTNYSKYIVNDLIKRNDLFILYIVNTSESTKPFIEYCTNNFYKISSLNQPNILSVYSFGIIEYIDDRPVNDSKYFYTTEYAPAGIINTVDKTFNNEEILSIYVKISRALNFLHFHGIIYKYLAVDTLIVNVKEDHYTLKLLDLISLQKKLLSRQFSENFTLNFLAPEIIHEVELGKYTDVYSLGIILFYLKTLENFKPSNLSKRIELCIENPSLKEELNYYKLIYDMTHMDFTKRIQSVDVVNSRIMQVFSYKLNIKHKSFVERLNFKTPIVGRNSEINKISSAIMSSNQDTENIPLVVIKGETGIGKTRLINEVVYKMQFNRVKGIVVTVTGEESGFLKIAPKILKQLYKIAPPNIVDKYSKELVKLTPEIGFSRSITPSKELPKDKEILRLYDRVTNFIIEVNMIKPIVITIDDFHFADISFIKFIEYLFNVNISKKSSLLIMISITDDFMESMECQELINRCASVNNIIVMKLSRLSLDETSQMTNNILGYLKNPVDIATMVFHETDGIPSLIEEMLRQLFAQKLLVVEHTELQGFEWKIVAKDYSKLRLPHNLDEAVLNQINSFNKIKRQILEIVSIFNTSTSPELIAKVLGLDTDLSKEFDTLTKLKILNEKLEDWGYTYGLNSLKVKNFIYNSIEENRRLVLHKRTSTLLEELYKKEGRENKDELIYQFLKSNQLDKVIDYYIESGKNMLRLRIYSQALDFFKRAYELITDFKDRRALATLMKIGETYQNLGRNKSAIESFEEAMGIARMMGNIERLIDAKNIIGYIYLLKNELNKSVEYLKRSISNAEEINYLDGLFRASYLLSKTYINTRQIKEMENICDKYLDLAYKNDRFDYVGIFLSQKGIAKHINGHSLHAIKYFNDSIQYLEKGEKEEETAGPINSIGLIYLEYFQEIKTARKYFERALNISQLYHRSEDVARAHSNIAESYMLEGDYEQAENVLNKNISLSLEHEDEILRFTSYVKLVECYVYLEEYKKAYNCLLEAQIQVLNYPIQSVHNEMFLESSAKFYIAMGYNEKTLEIIDSFEENFKEVDLRMKQKMRLIKFLAETNLGQFVDDKELLDILDVYRKTTYSRDRRVALLTAVQYFYFKGEHEKASICLKENSDLIKVIDSEFLKVRHRYQESLLDEKGDPIFILENLLIESFNLRCDEIKWVMYYTLGELHLHKKEFFKATNYFLSSLDTIKVLYNKIPDEFKEIYLCSSGRYIVKQKLLYMENIIRSNCCNDITWEVGKIDLKDYFNISSLKSLIQNPDFYRLALEQYIQRFPLQIDSIEDLICGFSNDTISSLESILAFISKDILATGGLIITNIDDKYNKIVSLGKDIQISEITHILEKIMSDGNAIYINNIDDMNHEGNVLYRDVKALICIPIMNIDYSDIENNNIKEENRRNKEKERNMIIGFIYLETDIVFHNFSEEAIIDSKKLLPLISIFLDNYYLKVYSSIDKLTGLYERKFFEKKIKDQIGKSHLSNQSFSIIMSDVDYFKNVNDTFGHQRGDQILSEAGSIIKKSIRRTDYAARYGGEEFIILLPNTNKHDAFEVAEKIRKRFKEEKLLGRDGNLTISCGIAGYPEDSPNQESIIEKADQALYKAKEKGRNLSISWEEGMQFDKKRVDRLAGIITGNTVEDEKNMLVLVKAIDMISEYASIEKKAYDLLGRLIEVLEAEEGMLFILNSDRNIDNRFFRKRLTDDWIGQLKVNEKLIERVIHTKQGEYLIDWEDTGSIDIFTGSPNWKSIIAMPIINNGDIKALLYFTAFTKDKEFDYNSYNLVRLISNIVSALFV